jgi:hypothetical protein
VETTATVIMSKTTKKKYVAQEVLNEFTIPEPPEQIVKVCHALSMFSVVSLCERVDCYCPPTW